MKVTIALIAVLAVACPVKSSNRYYDPKEEDPLRIRYLPAMDASGNIYYEDLSQEVPASRASTSDVIIYLYTPRNLNTPSQLASDGSVSLSSTNFDASLPIFFITHGWNNNYQSDVNVNVKAAIQAITNANIFVVDWSSITNGLYTISYANVESVGQIVGDYVYSIMTAYGLPSSQFRLVGHSLGAHVSGCIGAQVRARSQSLVASIVALDPAGPLFTTGNTANRVDPTDATFVQVIHTNGGLLGFGSAIGHADYYPNGGSSQPGCGLDLVGTCAHGRSYYYYSESVISAGFTSYSCDSISSYNNGNCNGNVRSPLGQLYVDTSAAGDYYLNTNSASPYSQG
ncbi:lipase [Holotrichia oblita]|uniref:Lipase n=1 Tax=Holotrichia oblita TaxID=644536 RepID=A0ACB9TQ07_HOLOL|nr:lipase [Holotrichia oblita]